MIRPLLIAATLTLVAPATAASFQDNKALDRAVAGFTEHAIGELGGARSEVDARLKLATCPTLALAWRTAARDAVVIRCTGPDWRIFVPVLMPATAPVVAEAPRPASAAFVPPAPPVIRRGDPVTVEAGTDGFSISREGVAMGDAAPGGRFLVKVEGARGPVQATAVEAGRATLPGWSQ